MMLGGMFFGFLADKIGRKKVIVICTITFSIFTLLSIFSNGATAFGITRFFAGLGLGGAAPNLIALMSEYSPKKLRATLVSIMYSAVAIGAVLSAVCGIFVIPHFGWEGMMIIGSLPLLLVPVLIFFLPESPAFCLANNRKQLSHVLRRVSPQYEPQENDRLVMNIPVKQGSPVVKLFTEKRATSTLVFWFVFFLQLLTLYALNTWVPRVMTQAGYEMTSSLLLLFILNSVIF